MTVVIVARSRREALEWASERGLGTRDVMVATRPHLLRGLGPRHRVRVLSYPPGPTWEFLEALGVLTSVGVQVEWGPRG